METVLEQRPISTPLPVWLRGERGYWLLQASGWGFIYLLRFSAWATFFSEGSPLRPARAHPVIFLLSEMVMPATGLLVSHLGRLVAHRWGWRSRSLLELAPRILVIAIVQGIVTGLADNWSYGIFFPAAAHVIPRGRLVLNLAPLAGNFLGWWGIYFVFQLFGRLAQSERDSLMLVARTKEAELLALKAQVNPHFIFNSLNSLRALIGEDAGRARQAVSELASLLRYGLQSGRLETVSLAEELRATRDYLALEQLRYEERLRVRIEAAPEALPMAIPPMLLQTLVENAIKHGIARCPAGGEIAIAAWCESGALRLEVVNPRVPGIVTEVDFSTGTGLRNATERARLLFGPEAFLRLRTDRQGGVVAEVSLPAHQLALATP